MSAAQITRLIDKLDKLGLSPQISKNTQYHDEPNLYSFNTYLKLGNKFSDGKASKGEPHGSGVSYFSAEDAVSKSIWEAMERFCNYSFRKKQIKKLKADTRGYNFLDLSIFSKDPQINTKKMGWAEGVDLFENKKTLIPAQLVYLNYKHTIAESYFDYPHNSTGSAGGNSPEMAILHGIYEIIERDSLIGVYLNKITPGIVDLKALKDNRIDFLIEKFNKYKLELYVLNSTTDLGIPSFISLIFDRTGAGPAVGIGAKAGFNQKEAIVGAIGEVLMTRIYTKEMLMRGEIAPDLKSATGLFPNRARHWITRDTIKNAEFMVKGKKIDNRPARIAKQSVAGGLHIIDYRKSLKQELEQVLGIIKAKGYKVYYVDCTIPEFRKLNFYTYFNFIPGLQPLYLREGERERAVNIKRLTQIAKHFGKEFDGINQVPHPFL